MATKWKIYCTEPGDEGWHYIWSDTAPTACPNNPAHSVNINSVVEVAVEVEQYRINPTFSAISKSSNFLRTTTFEFDPDVSGDLRRVKLVSNTDDPSGDYSIELYDVTHKISLSTDTFSNTNPDEIQVTSFVNTIPTEKSLIEVNVKKISGNKNAQVFIYQIIVYAENS